MKALLWKSSNIEIIDSEHQRLREMVLKGLRWSSNIERIDPQHQRLKEVVLEGLRRRVTTGGLIHNTTA